MLYSSLYLLFTSLTLCFMEYVYTEEIKLKRTKLSQQSFQVKTTESFQQKNLKIIQHKNIKYYPESKLTTNIKQLCEECNNYPKIIPNFNLQINLVDKKWQRMKNISDQSLLIAKQYVLNGLNEPSAQLIEKEMNYYQNRYNLSQIKEQLPLCVVILTYNNVQNDRYKLNLNSIFRQKYQNYKVVIIDDNSPDDSGMFIQSYINNNAPFPQRFKLIRNKIRKTAIGNQYLAGQNQCQEDSIYVMGPDGDDGLVGTLVFQLYNYYFQKYDNWVYYGQFIVASNGMIGSSQQVIGSEYNIRKASSFPVSHLKAFYTKLWRKVLHEDLLDQNGKYFDAAQDLAVIFPIVQMSGQRVMYIPQVTYLYINFHQHHNVNREIYSSKKIISSFRMPLHITKKLYIAEQIEEFGQKKHQVPSEKLILITKNLISVKKSQINYISRIALNYRNQRQEQTHMKHHPKVILLGDTGVGKTSLINALIQGNFKQTIANTLGVCFHRYKCDISKSQSVQIDIWDTAGQEKYRSLLTIYYKNTDGVILIFDLSRPHTFQTVMYWARQVQINSEKNPCIVLVGNKSDLKQQMQVPEKIVSTQKVQQFLKTKTNWKYFQSSAKDNKNVEQIFKQLTRMIIKANQKRIKYQKQRSDSHKMIKNRKRREERSCC